MLPVLPTMFCFWVGNCMATEKSTLTQSTFPWPRSHRWDGMGWGGVGQCCVLAVSHWPRLCSLTRSQPATVHYMISSFTALIKANCHRNAGFVGAYVVNQGRNGEESEVFSSDLLPGPGNDQPKQPFVIFQEIFLSFYEELQVFTNTLWRQTKLKINMPYKNY